MIPHIFNFGFILIMIVTLTKIDSNMVVVVPNQDRFHTNHYLSTLFLDFSRDILIVCFIKTRVFLTIILKINK